MDENSSLVIGFENWMNRGNEKNWKRLSDDRLRVSWKRYINNLVGKTGRDYSDAQYIRRSSWH